MEEILLTVDEVAKRLKISPRGLWNWAHVYKCGPVPFKLRNRVVYKERDVEAFIRQQYLIGCEEYLEKERSEWADET
jgi:hypothetical protein